MAKAKKGNYFIATLNGMAYGFFCSLIIGTILKQVGAYMHLDQVVYWGTVATYLMGPAIGAGIGFVIDAKGLNLISAIIAGAIGAGTFSNGVVIGNPVGSYLAVIIAIEATRLVQGKTPVDILLVPCVSILVSGVITMFLSPYITMFIESVGSAINNATTMQPILMSIVVAVLMGMALTAPISSAAIGVMLNLSGLAAGAALIGCCCQMIGIAMMSMDDNDIGDVIAIGIGTSMLQFNNLIVKPVTWLPPIIASAILAPIGVVLFSIRCNAIGSGMGSAGFVGIMSAIDVMGNDAIMVLVLFTILLPAIVTFCIYKSFRKLGWIKPSDLKMQKL